MIIKGKSRSGPAALAAHLLNAEKNERVTLIETIGTVAQDLKGALLEMDTFAFGTRCVKPLYHAVISPEPPHRLTPQDRLQAVQTLALVLELEDHARAVVIHEKEGREHIHVVWSRIDIDEMRSVSDSHNYRKHEECARALERAFGHDRVQGAHAEREGVERPERTPSRAELRQEERTGWSLQTVRDDVRAAYDKCDNAIAFQAALEQEGYLVARGDRRDFVIVDGAGGIHSLARRLNGVKAAALREFMKPINAEHLPTVKSAQDAIADRARHHDKFYDEGFKKHVERYDTDKPHGPHQERTPPRAQNRGADIDPTIEKAYARGDDYVSQTTAALKDSKKRQKGLENDSPRPTQPVSEDASDKEKEDLLRRQAEETTRRQESERSGTATPRSASAGPSSEATDAKQARLSRLLNAIEDDDRSNEREHPDPDGRTTAPGGGRTRGR